jgi:DNA-binding MurR/RpiR family transcriptional regulator
VPLPPPPAGEENLSIAQRIIRARPTLTRSHQKIADYVLAHPLQVATVPVDELAATVEVSIATANRFARAVGLEGYAQLRAELVRGFGAMLAPVEKLRSRLAAPSTVAEVFAATLDESRRNIEATRNALDIASCERAVEAVLGAHRIYIAGFGASGWLGGLLQRGIDPYCDNVQLLAGIAGSSYGGRLLPRMTPQDLLVAISYPRYITDTVYLAREASRRGVPVLAMTDGPTSPLAPLAGICLYAFADNQYAANSESSALALIEALSSAVAHRATKSLQSAARLTEAVLPWLHDDAAPAAGALRGGLSTRKTP